MAHAGRRSPLDPGEASPSFAQTGAEFRLDDSDDEAVIDEFDLRHEAARGVEAYEMVERDTVRRRMSASTVASFQLYTPDEDLAVRTKFDRKLVLFVALLYLLSFLDRSNIGNARIAGMDEDLQTTPPRDDWYEWALTAFYISYIAFEWMSLLFKLVPAHVVVSMTVLAWGLTASLQAIAPSYPVLIALRFASLSPIAPWRLLFLLEGLPSVLAAVAAFTTIPDSPSSAPYLTQREKKVARLRLRRDHHPSSHQPHEPASGLQPRDLLLVFADPVAWLTSAMFFLTNMAYSSLPVFLPKIVADMGHDALASQALSAPPYLVAFVVVLLTAHASDRLRARTVPIVLHALASAAGYGVLALAGPLRLPPFLRYLAVYPAAVGFFNVVTLIIAWSINNQASQTRQGGGFAVLQLIGQCGPLVGTRLYPDRDAPYYTSGMGACALAMLAVAVLAVVLRWYLRYRNRKMDQKGVDSEHDDYAVEEEGLVASGKRKTEPAHSFRYML
ncbi:putativetransporter [Metarhizium anisopliae]